MKTPCEPLMRMEASEGLKPLPMGRHGRFRVCLAGEEDRPKCWHLVHQEYLACGYEKHGESPFRYSIHDAVPGAASFLIEADGEAIGTVTVYPDSELGLPADEIYRDELDVLRSRGRGLVEVGRFAIRRDYSRDRYILSTLLELISIYTRSVLGATDIVITVNPSHVKFYERVLLFDRMGVEKTLDTVCGAPAVLMGMDLEFQEQVIRWEHGTGAKPEGIEGDRPTFYRHSAAEEEEAAKAAALRHGAAPLSEWFLRRHFVESRLLISGLSPAQTKCFEEWYSGYDLTPPPSWSMEITEEVLARDFERMAVIA